MTTVSELVQAAGRKIGVHSMSADEINDGMDALNMMLKEWSTKPSGVYAVTRESQNTSGGTASYSIGTGETWDTAWPVRIVESFIRIGNSDYPVEIIDGRQYANRFLKSLQTRPSELYYERTYPAGTVFLYPAPDTTYAVHLWSHKPIAEYSSTATTIALPPEYEAAMLWNLAIVLAPEFVRMPSGIVMGRAASTYSSLKAINKVNSPIKTDVIAGRYGRDFDITGSVYR